MSTARDQLQRMAEAVADGREVDWDAETSSDPAVLQAARNLRLIERIRHVHVGDNPIPDAWGPLEIRGRIGSGAYSDVFRAFDTALQTHVALKVLHADRSPENLDALLAEARNLAKIRHPNVVRVHGAAVQDGRVGIWTELIEGQTLEQVLKERGPYRAEEAALIGLDLVRALAAVHGHGLVHRDVKTSNVMREEGGRIVLTDFGTVVDAARLVSAEQLLVGTAHYMAPETLRGESGGKCGDIYALGVVLYRLVSARYPMEAKTLQDLLDQHKAGAARPLREARADVPAAYVRIVERAVAADPAARYANVGEMERDLAAFLGMVAPVRATRTRARVAFGALAGALIVAAIWFGARGRDAIAPLSVSCNLFRTEDGKVERLERGEPVEVGDHLFLELETSRPAWVYVFNEDEAGNAYLLFPLTALDVANPLPARRRWRLPGQHGDESLTWDVNTAGGRETMYVIASTEPLGDLEAALAGVPEAGMAKPMSEEILRRGMGALGRTPASEAPGPRLGDLFQHIAAAAVVADDMWTWSIDLENPGQ